MLCSVLAAVRPAARKGPIARPPGRPTLDVYLVARSRRMRNALGLGVNVCMALCKSGGGGEENGSAAVSALSMPAMYAPESSRHPKESARLAR